MSLIHELRALHKEPETEIIEYNPLFLTAIKKRGYFLISETSLYDEETECFRKTEQTLEIWLKQNKLKITKSEIKDHYKIYY